MQEVAGSAGLAAVAKAVSPAMEVMMEKEVWVVTAAADEVEEKKAAASDE